MDTDQLIAHAKARFAHEAHRRVLKEKYEAKMLFAYNGGMWRAGPDLLATLNFCRITDDSEVVLLDLYENPVKVKTKELWNLAAERWQEQMTAWHVEFEEARKNR
jgi:hypothetical protein